MNALARIRSSKVSRSTISKRTSFQPSWPNPTDSVGRFIAKIGNQSCWEAVGPARSAFQSLGREIKKYLDNYSEPLPVWVTWSIYMVGSTPHTATPTIIFCCENESHRKTVRNMVRDSRLLDAYSGVALKHLPRAPDYNQLVQLASERYEHVLVEPQAHMAMSSPAVLCNEKCIQPGSQLFIQSGQSNGTVRKATAGGMLRIGDKRYLMTAAHAFVDILVEDPTATQGDEDLFFSDSDEGGDEGASDSSYSPSLSSSGNSGHFLCQSSMTSSGSISQDPSLHDEHVPSMEYNTNGYNATHRLVEPPRDHHALPESALSIGHLAFSSIDGPHPELDYALIHITEDTIYDGDVYPTFIVETSNLTKIGRLTQNDDIQVISITASRGIITGHISTTPTFIRPPNVERYQEVYPVHFSSPLSNGDCGSWVIGAITSKLYGHVVAGSLDSGIAYMVPASQIFDDLQKNLVFAPVTCWGDNCDEHADDIFGKQVENVHRIISNDIADGEESKEHKRAYTSITPRFSHSSFTPIPSHTAKIASTAGSPKENDNTDDAPGDVTLAQDLTVRFRGLLSKNRREALSRSNFRRKTSPSTEHATTSPPSYPILRNIPLLPTQPRSGMSMKFRNMLHSLSNVPMCWENPGLLDEALRILPLQQIYEEAEEESQVFQAEGESLGLEPAWGYEDCVARALMHWFKREFFTWVNNPACPICYSPTVGIGMSAPTADEQARGANQVELYKCSNQDCLCYERFPRYKDPFVLLQTRRGRVGEWANCFGMLCRAVGCRVRWVWNAEDHIWVELYSLHRRRWVHVEVCEEAWDKPLIYTHGWDKKLSYCIAFSPEGACDVTRRYVRSPRYALSRDRCTESELFYIIEEIRTLRREKLSKEDNDKVQQEHEREEMEMAEFGAKGLAAEFCDLRVEDRGARRRKAEENSREGIDVDIPRFVQ